VPGPPLPSPHADGSFGSLLGLHPQHGHRPPDLWCRIRFRIRFCRVALAGALGERPLRYPHQPPAAPPLTFAVFPPPCASRTFGGTVARQRRRTCPIWLQCQHTTAASAQDTIPHPAGGRASAETTLLPLVADSVLMVRSTSLHASRQLSHPCVAIVTPCRCFLRLVYHYLHRVRSHSTGAGALIAETDRSSSSRALTSRVADCVFPLLFHPFPIYVPR